MEGKIDLYKNKYRRQTTRLKQWEYTRNGRYFVTICTKDRRHYFGQIVSGKMELSDVGRIAHEEWEKTFQIRPYVHRDEFVVMPNHVHMIVWIDHEQFLESGCGEQIIKNGLCGCGDRCVGQCGVAAPRRYGGVALQPKSGSLGSIVGSYKSQCSRRINESGHAGFHWQENYWDSIIWDEESYVKIVYYIRNNPKKWYKDYFYGTSCG